MEISTVTQLQFTAYALLFGIGCAVFYDVFRVIRVMLGVGYRCTSRDSLDKVSLPLIGARADRLAGRKKSKLTQAANTVFIFIADIVYFIPVTAAAMIFIFNANSGIPRWYYAAAAIAGFAVYYFTLGALVMQISGVISFVVKTIFSYVYFFTVRPLVWLYRTVARLCVSAAKKLRHVYIFCSERAYSKRMCARLSKEIPSVFAPGKIKSGKEPRNN